MYKTYKIPKYDKNGKKIRYKKVKSKVKMCVETTVVKANSMATMQFFIDNCQIGAKKISIKAKSLLPKAKHPSIDI